MTEADLLKMPLESTEDAQAFLAAFALVEAVEGPNNCAPRPASQMVPWVLRSPKVWEKRARARSLLRLNYWEMSYERAVCQNQGLTHERWLSKRKAEGLSE